VTLLIAAPSAAALAARRYFPTQTSRRNLPSKWRVMGLCNQRAGNWVIADCGKLRALKQDIV
jgi:hypothetical protein